MKKTVKYVLLAIVGLPLLVYVVLIVGLNYQLSRLGERKVAPVFRGQLPAPTIAPLPKLRVCPHFPEVLFSEKEDDMLKDEKGMCVVIYQGQRLALIDRTHSFQSLAQAFRSEPTGAALTDVSDQEIVARVHEMHQRPFILWPSRQNLVDVYVYWMGSMGWERRAARFDKFTDGDKIVYVWSGYSDEEPGYERVEMLSPSGQLGCMGHGACVPYLKAIGAL